jgi:beta-galactosidase
MPVIDHVATWNDVALAPGRNRIEISSGDLKDEAVWIHDPNGPVFSRPVGTAGPPAE